MIKRTLNIYKNKRIKSFNEEEKYTYPYPFLIKKNYLQREETNVFTKYIRYIKLLNHIIIKGATYKQ